MGTYVLNDVVTHLEQTQLVGRPRRPPPPLATPFLTTGYVQPPLPPGITSSKRAHSMAWTDGGKPKW